MATLRRYVTKTTKGYSGTVLTDEDRLARAEAMIDEYVGFIDKHVQTNFRGAATSGSTTSLIDTSDDSPLGPSGYDGYLTFCVLEILSGASAGERRAITAHDASAQQITVAQAFTSAIVSGVAYRIQQLGKFPRALDVEVVDDVYYKLIPEAVQLAVLAQVDYMTELGDDFFRGGADLASQSIDDISETYRGGAERMVSPKAREYLRGIRNLCGELI